MVETRHATWPLRDEFLKWRKNTRRNCFRKEIRENINSPCILPGYGGACAQVELPTSANRAALHFRSPPLTSRDRDARATRDSQERATSEEAPAERAVVGVAVVA